MQISVVFFASLSTFLDLTFLRYCALAGSLIEASLVNVPSPPPKQVGLRNAPSTQTKYEHFFLKGDFRHVDIRLRGTGQGTKPIALSPIPSTQATHND